MLGQRRRRWHNTDPALAGNIYLEGIFGECVFALRSCDMPVIVGALSDS